ncbi:MAG: aryl-sulfate sulfotransferase [Bryobacteraceae bacterium]
MKIHSLLAAAALLTLWSCASAVRLDAAIQAQAAVSLPSPQPVGTAVTITASSTNSNPGPTTYKFEIASGAGGSFGMVRDFSVTKTYLWVPTTPEGDYQIRVTARDYLAGESSQVIVPYTLTTRINGGLAALTLSTHPLVALFSAPPCAAGRTTRVRFARTGTAAYSFTNSRPCASTSTNFLVAGLYPSTSYTMSFQILTGSQTYTSPGLSVVTGTAPFGTPIASTSMVVPAAGQSSPEKIVLIGFPGPYVATAYDKAGRNVWYYPDTSNGCQLVRPLAGGTMLLICSGQGTGTGFYGPTATRQQILREIDLAGNVLHEISADRVSEFLQALGKDPIGRFNHDAIRLSNGHTVALGDAQRAFPAGTQGAGTSIDLIGAVIVDLDSSWNLAWNWNAFDHAAGGTQLDANRTAIRGEKCSYNANNQTPAGCPPVLLAGFTTARDWLHSNSLDLMQDGALIMSIRNQDWVVKIDYNNGTGAGDILWRMGVAGDFTFINNLGDPYPWFSGQHEAAWEFNGTQYLSLFDNGNTRIGLNGGNSRGQVLLVDEPNRTATFFLNADLGLFAVSHGSAQALSNGNWTFQADRGSSATQVPEVLPNSSTQVFNIQGNGQISYRSWRLTDFYTAPKN